MTIKLTTITLLVNRPAIIMGERWSPNYFNFHYIFLEYNEDKVQRIKNL